MVAAIRVSIPVCIGGSLWRMRSRQRLHKRLAPIAVPFRIVA